MSESNIIKTKRDVSIILADNSGFGGSNVYTISAEPGDLNLSIPKQARNNFLDRGLLVSSVRYGDQQPVTGSFSAYFRDATDASVATLMDLLCDSGYVDTGWVSTLGSSAEVMSYDLRIAIEGSDHGDGADHSITVADVSLDGSWADGDPISVSVNFQSHTDWRPTLA